jgi:Urocanase Rossmann-like domain
VYRCYASLAATTELNADSGLGGKLVFAGEINDVSRNLLYAANIARAASLAASEDAAVQRQAMRDGVVDFVVTSLEEALRILKNEVRKRQPVSVGVAIDPVELGRQMIERGVLPDLLPPGERHPLDRHQAELWLNQGARRIGTAPAFDGEFVSWSVRSEMARDFAQWMPKIDACVMGIVPADDYSRQRWVRLAPRYLGRMAQRWRGVMLSEVEWKQLIDEAWKLMSSGGTGSIILEIGGNEISLS